MDIVEAQALCTTFHICFESTATPFQFPASNFFTNLVQQKKTSSFTNVYFSFKVIYEAISFEHDIWRILRLSCSHNQ